MANVLGPSAASQNSGELVMLCSQRWHGGIAAAVPLREPCAPATRRRPGTGPSPETSPEQLRPWLGFGCPSSAGVPGHGPDTVWPAPGPAAGPDRSTDH